MSDLTRVLSLTEQGDPEASEQLLPMVYEGLLTLANQTMAQEPPNQTLHATGFLHNANRRPVELDSPGIAPSAAAVNDVVGGQRQSSIEQIRVSPPSLCAVKGMGIKVRSRPDEFPNSQLRDAPLDHADAELCETNPMNQRGNMCR